MEVFKQAGIAEVEIDAKMIGKGAVGLYEKFGFRVGGTVSLDDESEDVYFHTMTLKLTDRKDQSRDHSCPTTLPCPETPVQEEGDPSAPSREEEFARARCFSRSPPRAAR